MKNSARPDPNTGHPIKAYDKEKYVKPAVTNPNIIVGSFIGDKLIIGSGADLYPVVLSRAALWDKSIEEIDGCIPVLSCIYLEKAKSEILKNTIQS